MRRPLPELVLGLIASELQADKQALLSFSLLSSSHVFPARQYLFRQLTIKLDAVDKTIDRLIALLKDQPNIPFYIRNLTLVQTDIDKPTHSSLNLGHISQVVCNIPYLEALRLEAVTWSTPTASYVALTPHSHLNTLELSHVQGVEPLDNPLELLCLASHWHSVVIHNTACRQELQAPAQHPLSISTLRLHWQASSRGWLLSLDQAKLVFAGVKHVQLVAPFDRHDYEQVHTILLGGADAIQKLTLNVLHWLWHSRAKLLVGI
ncbi:hypothetical protein EIP86_010023 [Pleurotus ostreatoroseus]|nr:hypothetical protein EIP86_010023 [Pleurotus ostreatoroseus]